ncbi:MAG: hypothetical protein SGI71_09910, partial [Verrucomicrobiota bacterium]|nr:hypothetical protein [Verrucomicrobiota bacterium]
MPSPVAPRPAAPRPLPGGIPEPSQTILSPPKRQPSAAVNPAVPAAAAAPLPAPVEGEIAVPYSVLAKGLPPDVVNPGMESSDKTVNFPAQLIVDQLSLGKVSILLKDIAERAPDLLADPANIVDQPINLPLGDMFKLVSPSFLKRRPDQIIQKIEGDDIPTPFSEMAKKAAAAQASAASASGAAPAPAPAPAPAALKPAAPAPASMQSVTPVAPAPKPAVSGQQGGRPIIPPAPMTAPINPAARGPSPVPPAVRPVVPPAPATMALNKGTAVPSPSPNPGTAPIVRPSGFGGPSKPPIPPA